MDMEKSSEKGLKHYTHIKYHIETWETICPNYNHGLFAWVSNDRRVHVLLWYLQTPLACTIASKESEV